MRLLCKLMIAVIRVGMVVHTAIAEIQKMGRDDERNCGNQ